MKNRSSDGLQEFLKLCLKTSSTKELRDLFDLFFTLEEKDTLASRFVIVKALFLGKLTQREIAEECEVSIAQITRGSNALKIITPQLKKLLTDEL